MRNLTSLEISQLILLREAGGLTEDGELLYQQVMSGDLSYDDQEEATP
jgi:hypothetical protein